MKKIITFLCFTILYYTVCAQSWTEVTTSYPNSGGGRGCAAFSIGGTCYFVGGGPYDYQTWAFDTLTQNWTQMQDYPNIADGTYIGFSLNGLGYVCTGVGYGYNWDSTMWQFNPTATTQWTKLAHFPGQPRGYGVGFTLDGMCFMGCGIGNSVGSYGLPLNDFYEYNPATNTWKQIASYPGAGTQYNDCFVVGDKAYVGGGNTISVNGTSTLGVNDDFWEYDTTSKVWTQIANFSGGNRSAATGFNTCDKGFLGLGYSDVNQQVAYNDFWEYDPGANTWTQIGNYGGVARFVANGFTIGKSFFAGTGVNSSGGTQYDVWELIRSFTPGFYANTSTCQGGSITFTDTSSYNPTNWEWSFPGGTPDTSSMQNPVVTYDTAGTYPVTLTAWNGCGDSGSVTMVNYITVNPYSGNLSITPDSPSVCIGQTITLRADGGAGAIYQWVGTSDTTDSILVNPTKDTTYELVVGSGSCSKDTIISVTVNTPAALVINPPSPAEECSGQGIILIADTTGSNYMWSPSAGLGATTGNTVLANPTTNVTYTVTGIDSLGCSVTATEELIVNQGPNKPIITVSANGDTLISSAKNGNQWYLNGQPVTGAVDSTYVIIGLPKGDTVTVSVTDVANGCSTTSDSLILSGINQLAISNNQLSIYPNPSSGVINVTISSSAGEVKDWNLQLTDVLGRLMYSRTSLNYTNEIDVSNLPAGVYFITIKNKISRAVFPIVKQNY